MADALAGNSGVRIAGVPSFSSTARVDGTDAAAIREALTAAACQALQPMGGLELRADSDTVLMFAPGRTVPAETLQRLAEMTCGLVQALRQGRGAQSVRSVA